MEIRIDDFSICLGMQIYKSDFVSTCMYVDMCVRHCICMCALARYCVCIYVCLCIHIYVCLCLCVCMYKHLFHGLS